MAIGKKLTGEGEFASTIQWAKRLEEASSEVYFKRSYVLIVGRLLYFD
jgi:hypothetical protein